MQRERNKTNIQIHCTPIHLLLAYPARPFTITKFQRKNERRLTRQQQSVKDDEQQRMLQI